MSQGRNGAAGHIVINLSQLLRSYAGVFQVQSRQHTQLFEYGQHANSDIGSVIDFNPFYMKLNEFSAKYDTIPAMLIQNHKNLIKGFLGQTTAFHLNLIKLFHYINESKSCYKIPPLI